MRKSKFTDSQIMDAVKRVEAGFAVPDICRELGINTATFYKWRVKYGGMSVSLAACQEGVAASLLFMWRKLERQGALTAVSAGEAVVPASELASSTETPWS